MRGMKLRRVNDEVFFAEESLARIGPEEIEFLKQRAVENPRRRARICLHRSEADPIQEMIIAVDASSYVRPHRHLARSETFHAIAGTAEVILFDESGAVTERVRLSAEERDLKICRVNAGCFHSLLVRTPMFVLRESTSGPFERTGTEYAAWSPIEGDSAEISRYLTELEAQLSG